MKKALLWIGVAVILGVGVFWFVWTATGEPVKVVRAHLAAINEGDYTKAYSLFSSTLKTEISLEQYREFVEKNAAVMKTRDTTFSSRSISGNTATLLGTLTGQKGDATSVRFTLVKQGESWLIESIRLGAGAEE